MLIVFAVSYFLMIIAYYGLHCAVAQRVGHWTCDQQVVGSNPTRGNSCITTLGKLFTPVPLSPNSITWYRPRGGDALWLGR